VSDRSENVVWHAGELTPELRREALGHGGATIWMTGLPASGKSSIAVSAEARLVRAGRPALVLDGDNLRHGLNGNLGFSPEDRTENVRRTAHAAALLAEAGVVALVSLVSPYEADRAAARAVHAERGLAFAEVWVATPLEECERRDPKGLYARARAGELPGLTGVGAPYEEPAAADLVLHPEQGGIEAAADRVEALVFALAGRPAGA
jgi:bifunctional enzyme CysN/CysC